MGNTFIIVSCLVYLILFYFILKNHKLGIYLIIASLPLIISETWYFTHIIKLDRIFAVMTVISYGIYLVKNKKYKSFNLSEIFPAFAAYLVFCCISLLYSMDIKTGAVSIFRMGFNFILFLILLNSINKKEETNRIIKIITIEGVIITLMGIYEYITLQKRNFLFFGIEGRRIAGLIGDPNYNALYLIYINIFLLYYILNNRRLIQILGFIFMYLINFGAIILTMSRSGFLTVIAGNFIFLILHKKIKYIVAAIILVAFLGSVIYITMPKRVHDALDMHASINMERVIGYKIGWRIMKDNFWLGVGIGGYRKAFFKYKLPQEQSTAFLSHFFLQRVAAETGIVGLLLIFYFLYVLFKSFYAAYCNNKGHSEINIFITLITCQFINSFLLGLFIYSPFIWMFLAIYFKLLDIKVRNETG